MNVYISADIEGVAGITSWDQVLPGGGDYAVGRALMTGEVNAAIEGAFAGGAERVVVNDAHALMNNLLPEAIDPRALLITGHSKPMYMMQGLDEQFDAVFFIGYHGAVGAPSAILSHTYNPRALWEVKVDGRVAGELSINALVCEYFGTPIRLVSGDAATAAEARQVAPDVHVAEVKRSFSRYSAESLSPHVARQRVRTMAQASLGALTGAQPVRRTVELEMSFLIPDMADMAEWIRGVTRVGPRTVLLTAEDGLQAYRAFYAVLTLTRSIVE